LKELDMAEGYCHYICIWR